METHSVCIYEGIPRKILSTKQKPIVNVGATIPWAIVIYEMEGERKGNMS